MQTNVAENRPKTPKNEQKWVKIAENGRKRVGNGRNARFLVIFWGALVWRKQPHGLTRTSTDGHGHLERRFRVGNSGKDEAFFGRSRALVVAQPAAADKR